MKLLDAIIKRITPCEHDLELIEISEYYIIPTYGERPDRPRFKRWVYICKKCAKVVKFDNK
jgi:hypothetical protein